MSAPEIHLRFEWLAARCTVPGVLDADRLRTFAARFQRRSVRHGLLERLLRRLAMFADVHGETLIWRMPWEGDGAALDTLPVAHGSVVAAQTTAPGVMRVESATILERVTPSIVASERGAASISMELPRPIGSVPAPRDSARAAGLIAAAMSVSRAEDFAAIRATAERSLSDPVSFGTRLQDRDGGLPSASEISIAASPAAFASRAELPALATRADAPLARPPLTRAPENSVLREAAIPSSSRAHDDITARESETHVRASHAPLLSTRPTTQPMDILSHASVVTSASVVRQASAGDTARPFATETKAAAAVERKPDSPARAPLLLLRKPVPAKSPEPAGVTDSSGNMPRQRVSDSAQAHRNHSPETHRAAAPLSTPQRMDTIQFDALIERLVARLELEARRQGRYRWR